MTRAALLALALAGCGGPSVASQIDAEMRRCAQNMHEIAEQSETREEAEAALAAEASRCREVLADFCRREEVDCR